MKFSHGARFRNSFSYFYHLVSMKQFLLSNPANQKWVEAQEKLHSSRNHAESVARMVRREVYPELRMQSLEPLQSSGSMPSDLAIEARQRSLHRKLMKQLLVSAKNRSQGGKQTVSVYRTLTWKNRSKAIFFYFHDALGNLDAELTCKLFCLNISTFENWIRQRQYYEKWLPYVDCFTVEDILFDIPATLRTKYENVELSSKWVMESKYRVLSSGKKFVSAASSGTRQKNRKIASNSKDVIYLCQSTKTAGSGRNIKYHQEEEFIIEQVVVRWETGNPLCKSSAYDLLLHKFGHENIDERTEWEKKMAIHEGIISPALSQWLARVLKRHRFSNRKESISQTVPLNWLQICLDATGIIRQTMSNAQVTRLVNADKMFLQYYPKETHLIAPVAVKRVGSNRSEDEKKGCTVMVACEMFESRLMAPILWCMVFQMVHYHVVFRTGMASSKSLFIQSTGWTSQAVSSICNGFVHAIQGRGCD